MAKKLSGDELNIVRKSRRRLIGAVVLTLVVVVLLPMVLDSEPKPSGENIELRIPSPNAVGEFVSGIDVVKKSTSSSSTTVKAPIPTHKKTISNRELPVAKPHNGSASRKSTDEASSANNSSGDEVVAVQVAAYSNASTAKQELQKLLGWGFKAYTEKSGEMVRVRIGPYTDRNKAEKVVRLLENHDLKAVIVATK